MTLVTSNTPGKNHCSQKKVEGAASAARKFKHSDEGTMPGNPLPTDIYFRGAAVAARASKQAQIGPPGVTFCSTELITLRTPFWFEAPLTNQGISIFLRNEPQLRLP